MRRGEQLGLWRPYHAAMKHNGTAFVRAGIGLAVLAAGWLGGCSDDPGGPACCDSRSPGLIVSDPVLAVAPAAATAPASALASAGEDVAYVSLPPGTVPSGSTAIIRRVGDAGSIITAVSNGGFDPVPVQAQTSDSIEVVVRDAGGTTVAVLGLVVAAARPPIVVRTDPPRKKTDVPVNAAIVIVFSEPVAEGTLSASSVRLFRGLFAGPVAGTARVLTGTGTLVAFVPSAPLSANTPYRLEITRAVTDRDGDALAAGVAVTFTTGQSSTGQPASIELTPGDSIFMTSVTYQMKATVRDGAGNVLIEQPIIWSTDDPSGLAVSQTGLLTALAAGRYVISASVNGLVATIPVYVIAGAPASVTVAPTSATLAAGDTIMLVATVRDAEGRGINGPSVTWTSSDAALATVAGGTVTGVSEGSVTITATSGTASGTADVMVGPQQPVASVTVTPSSAMLVLQGKAQLSATLRDANGRVLFLRSITWASDDLAVATVDANGLVTAVGEGSAAVSATSEGVSDTAAITVTAISLASVVAGRVHTCGVATGGSAYCWGWNAVGQLGTGWTGTTVSTSVPVAVTGGLTFTAVAGGLEHTCGIATNATAYCWGSNSLGQLGTGSTNSSSVPVAVTGGLSLTAVTAGDYHTCGLTTAGAAYCWGQNNAGTLGNGAFSGNSSVPVTVTGGLSFTAIASGRYHTCGVTNAGVVYCWGVNDNSQLGDGSTSHRSVPTAVSGGLTFAAVAPGSFHTCGLTTNGAAYCWGDNQAGQLGSGSTTRNSVPQPIAGGLAFASVHAGGIHTCGLTVSGTAYCWGSNGSGQLGNGTTNDSSIPVMVTGGHTFAALSSVAAGHTCGLTVGGIAYCWGRNGFGQLGNSTVTDNSAPVRVAGQP